MGSYYLDGTLLNYLKEPWEIEDILLICLKTKEEGYLIELECKRFHYSLRHFLDENLSSI